MRLPSIRSPRFAQTAPAPAASARSSASHCRARSSLLGLQGLRGLGRPRCPRGGSPAARCGGSLGWRATRARSGAVMAAKTRSACWSMRCTSERSSGRDRHIPPAHERRLRQASAAWPTSRRLDEPVMVVHQEPDRYHHQDHERIHACPASVTISLPRFADQPTACLWPPATRWCSATVPVPQGRQPLGST